MKKTILGIAFMMMAGFAASASSQCPNEANCPDKDNCKKVQCDKNNCKPDDCKKADCKLPACKGKPGKKFDRNGNCEKACQFEGLNLTEEQKVKLQDLDNAMKVSRNEMRAEARENKGKGRLNFRENEKNLRTKYLDDLQKILSGDQYMQFLQNFYINQMPSPTMKNGIQRMDGRLVRAAQEGKFEVEKGEKAVVKEAKKIDKKIEKDVKKAEKKK
ncbi:MAG: hypothetical protein K2H96_00110 [Muribaculaceae bacterium]|nr:hypothetical protein [Muribaculaceae bacterium]